MSFDDSLLEMQMFQTMKGIGMDEGADRPLFVKNLCSVGHLRAKTFPLHICGCVSLVRRRVQLFVHILGSYCSWPFTEPGTLPPALH